jgi:glycerol uptake operon antiterminator
MTTPIRHVMHSAARIENCFSKPVIPVLWQLPTRLETIACASTVILQGGSIAELSGLIRHFEQPPLEHIHLLVHIDLVSGLENNEAGLECLALLGRIEGVVSIHHHLTKPAKRFKLLSIVRLFLSDSRAMERGLSVAGRSRPDAIEILPAVAAVKTSSEFQHCPLPRITGGLCKTEEDVREALASGCQAVTSTLPRLWELNSTFRSHG